MLAALFLYPEVGRLELALQAARETCRQSQKLPELTLLHLKPLVAALEKAADGAQAVLEEYMRLFLASSGQALCPPYESVFRDRDRQAAAWTMAELDRTYAVAGLRLSSSRHEMPDHASVELEFMSYLCRREAEAWEKRDGAAGIQAIRDEAGFLGEHLERWFPDFAAVVSEADGEGMYGTVVETARAFIVRDRDLLAALLADLPTVFEWEVAQRWWR